MESPLSATHDFWKLEGLFAKIRSKKDGLTGFLLQVGSFMRLVRSKVPQKLEICLLSASILNSPVTIESSYVADYVCSLAWMTSLTSGHNLISQNFVTSYVRGKLSKIP